MKRLEKNLGRAFSLCLSLAVAGCAVGPDFEPPSPQVADSFSKAGANDGDFAQGEADIDGWWSNFNDAELDSLIHEAVTSNNDLESALARVNQARAARKEAFLDLIPTVTAGGKYSRTYIPTSTFAG